MLPDRHRSLKPPFMACLALPLRPAAHGRRGSFVMQGVIGSQVARMAVAGHLEAQVNRTGDHLPVHVDLFDADEGPVDEQNLQIDAAGILPGKPQGADSKRMPLIFLLPFKDQIKAPCPLGK